MSKQIEAKRERVREFYAHAVTAATDEKDCCSTSCCSSNETHSGVSEGSYSAEDLGQIPVTAINASMGCGNPTAVSDLKEGDVVLDLGSGGGIDVILSAQRVGTTGTVYGLDMTDEMLTVARRNASDAGVVNVHFLKGVIEQIPLPANSVDVVISNCVINLSADKSAVFAEIARVLKPGGRIGISDLIADETLSAAQRASLGGEAECYATSMKQSEYVEGLASAGLQDISITLTHQVIDGVYSAIIKAAKQVSTPMKTSDLR